MPINNPGISALTDDWICECSSGGHGDRETEQAERQKYSGHRAVLSLIQKSISRQQVF
jgi:hypothetical protein